jgi:hypothetical protein
MDKFQLAEWLHDNYEQIAKAENWQTQEITRVKFDDLPAENKRTMLALADKMLNTFLIISANVPVSGSWQFTLVDVKDKLPTLENDEGVVIAFVPFQGFQSCKYHNGSKSWQSLITGQTVEVTHWLFRHDR